MWKLIIFCPGAYLLGSVPFGLLVSRLFRRPDPRELGSGNIGATNVFRSAGAAPGLITVICDVAKGWIPVWTAGQALLPAWATALVGMSAFLGHLYPVYLRFHGGKGVATAAGIFLAVTPYAALGSAIIFSIGVWVSGYVSLGSILASLGLPLLVLALRGLHPSLALALLCSSWVLWRHIDNIRRLRAGQETSWRPPCP